MKGWRPSACEGSKAGPGPFQAAHSPPDSLNNRPVFPVLGVMATRTTRFAFLARIRLAALKSQTTPKSVRDSKKGASPSLAPIGRRLRKKTEGMTSNPKSTRPKTAQLAKSSRGKLAFLPPALILSRPLPKAKGLEGCSLSRGGAGGGRIGALGSAPFVIPGLDPGIRTGGSRSHKSQPKRGRGAGLAAAFSRSFGHNALISLNSGKWIEIFGTILTSFGRGVVRSKEALGRRLDDFHSPSRGKNFGARRVSRPPQSAASSGD